MTERYPFRSPRARIPVRVRVVAAIEVRGRLLFKRRAPEGLLGGLWELPGVYLKGREGNKAGCRRIRKQVGSLVTLQRIPERSHFSVKHVYSHFEESIRVFLCKGKTPAMETRKHKMEQTYRWICPTKLDPYPLTGATRKVLHGLEQRKAVSRG
jgi:A/G-specific adenine glycosylase